MSILSWLTGHDDKESDVYANFDKVDQVVSELKSVSKTTVSSGQDAVNAALTQLNNVKGLAEYVGTIAVGSYDPVFSSISTSIDSIGTQITGKADAIKVYNESSILEKIGSSLCMGLSKLGEGIFSVGESLIDGAASIVGWVSGACGNTDLQKSIGEFIKKDYSHDMFNVYYNSDFAKASLFTENSALSSGCKIVGKTVGLLYAGGTLAGMGSSLGIGKTAVGTFAKGLASSTTWGATVAGGLSGLGSGVESGLGAGLDYNSAMRQGVVQGGIQAGLAFAGGKLGEGLQKSQAMKSATTESAKAAVKATRLSDYQGYTDAVTKAGQQFGAAQVNTIKSGINALSASAKASTASMRGLDPVQQTAAQQAAATARSRFGVEASELIHNANPIVHGIQGVQAVGSGIAHLPSTISNAVSGAVHAPGAVANAVKSTGVVAATKTALTSISPAVPGVVAATGEALTTSKFESVSSRFANGTEITRAAGNGRISDYIDKSKITMKNDDETKWPSDVKAYTDNDPNGVGQVTPTVTSTPTVTPGGTNPGGSYPGGSYPGGSYPGGSNPGGSNPIVTSIMTPTATPTPVPIITPTPISTPVPTQQPSYEPAPSYAPQPGPGEQQPSSVAPIGTPSPSQTEHTGVGFTPINGFATDGNIKNSDELLNAENLLELDDLEEIDGELSKEGSALDDIINGSNYTKVPTTTIPTSSKKKGSSNSVIPIAAGLSAAAAAGLGAKAYLDAKHRNDEEDDEEYDDDEYDDDFETDEWEDDGNTVDVEYNSDGEETTDYDNEGNDEEYYQDYGGSYSARSNDELADLE